MATQLNLSILKPGEKATVTNLLTKGSMRRRLLDIGLIKGTGIECVGKSPTGDPTAFLIRGAVIALRTADCKNIIIQKNEDVKSDESEKYN